MASMKARAALLAAVLITVVLAACGPAPQPTATPRIALTDNPSPTTVPAVTALASPTAVATRRCSPTFSDELSPSYKPDAPVRFVVGRGHILTGNVSSSADCAPIPNVKLEFWPEEPGLGHPDEYRATLFTGADGAYRFECNPTDHIHMRISAEEYRGIASNAYHTEGRPEGTFDIVLEPDTP